MYVDLPKISRCCFCVPLRYGLQVWAYIKLILEVAFTIFALVNIWPYLSTKHFMSAESIILLTLFIDIIFTGLLVIATHKKNEKLFNFYYIFSIVIAVLLVADIVIDTVYSVIAFSDSSMFGLILLNIAQTNLVVFLGLLVLQGYIILLVRSEMVKLRDQSNVQFYNHTSDATNQKVAVNLP